MRKRILAVLAALTLAVGLPAAVPSQVAAVSGWCANTFPDNFHTGMWEGSPSYSVYKVQAYITTRYIDGEAEAFAICDTHPLDWDDNGPIAYVSIEPYYSYGTEAIIQVGITKCVAIYYPAPNPCHGQHEPHYFWAMGGCNGAVPHLRDLGPATYGRHPFVIWRYANNYGIFWRLQVNGGADNPAGKYVDINVNNSAISCWDHDTLRAGWYCERWDTGDSCGSPSSANLMRFDTAAFQIESQPGVWKSPNWPVGGSCPVETGDGGCGFNAHNAMFIWNTN